jgi:hypothetical protein
VARIHHRVSRAGSAIQSCLAVIFRVAIELRAHRREKAILEIGSPIIPHCIVVLRCEAARLAIPAFL